MYSQNIIDIIGQRKVLDEIFNLNCIDYNSLNENDIKMRNAIEHFIIKFRNNPSVKDFIDKYLEKYVKQFEFNPHLYTNSILINQLNVSNFFTNEQCDVIKKGINEVYEKSKIIYEKYKNNLSITDLETQILMKYLTCIVNTNNYNLQQVQKECIKIILNKKNNISLYEKEFLANYVSNYTINLSNPKCEKPKIYLSNLRDNLGGYQLYNEIFLSIKENDLNKTIPLFIQVVCHETNHILQRYDSKNNSDDERAYCYSRRELFNKYLNTKNYDSYKAGKNYQFESIEKDAERMGFWYAGVFLKTFGASEEARNLRNIYTERENNKKYHFSYKTTVDNKYVPEEIFNVENLNDIVLKNPGVIKEYPVLNKLYNEDGTSKKIEEYLTTPCFLRDLDKHYVYNNHIIYNIHKNNILDNFQINTYSKEEQKNIFNRIVHLISIESEKILNIFKDSETKIDKDFKKVICNYHMKLLIKMVNFINKNYHQLKVVEENSIFNSGIFRSDVKSLNYYLKTQRDNIDEILIDQYEILYETINLTYKAVNHYENLDYVRSILNSLSEENLKKKIELDNGCMISFRQYMEEIVVDQIVSHKVFYNNEWISVRQYIKDFLLNSNVETKKL